MRVKEKILTITAIMLVLFAIFAPISINSLALAQPNATLTGNIYDYGEDMDGDDFFNFLVVEVEVNVYEAGVYRVQIDELRDAYYRSVYFNSFNETYLDPGMQNVTLSFNGIAIYGNKLNATHAVSVSLSYKVGTTQYTEIFLEIPLPITYDYTSFDSGAILTGVISSEGIDTDSDGLYNSLQVGVEISVTDAAWYNVSISGLIDVSGYQIDIYNYTIEFLDPGTQFLNVSLHGAAVYASHATNISEVMETSLDIYDRPHSYRLDCKSFLLLSREYSYEEFETPAYFTGTIFDKGVDIDVDPKFDYLEISVEINFTEAGNYAVKLRNLLDDAQNCIYAYEYVSSFFEVGIHLVNLTVYGPIIYASHLNPSYIEHITIWSDGLVLDSLSKVPLPTPYNYSDFESHALLTGSITDGGVDTDGDGSYDYLEIGIEIEVTEAGKYEIYAEKLMEQIDGSIKYLPLPQWIEDYFDVGNHMVYLSYHGPRLAYEHFSPTNVTGIHLTECIYPYVQLGYISSAPLSQRYDYTLFDAPLKDMQVDFVVYPNGTLGIGGTFNFTHMYPQNMGPLMNTTLSISTLGETTTGTASGTIEFPEDSVPEWPFYSTTANLVSQYDNGGLLNATLNATIFMPPEGRTAYPTNASDFSFNSTYSNGLLYGRLWGETEIPSYDSTFPFNVTDIIVLADYIENEIKGNVTFRTVSGFPLSDVIVYFDGNKTDLHLTGNLTVIYGDYFDMKINATTLEEMLAEWNSTIPGPTGLVYNMTWGLLECTQLNTTKTPMDEIGAIIEYNATIHGNFTGFLAKLLTGYSPEEPYPTAYPTVYAALDSALSSVQNASIELIYWHTSGIASIDLQLKSDVKVLWNMALELVPPTVPIEYRTQWEALLKIANATAHAIQDFSLNASYSCAAQKLDLDAWLSANTTQLKNDVTPILPDTVPPELRGIVESYVNTTYCTLTSSTITITYINGTANFEIDWTLQGDFKAQVNHTKRFYIDCLNATSPWGLTWENRVLNQTEININNLEAEFKIDRDWMYLTFNGLIAEPPKDGIDFIRFKLYRWLDMTSDPEAPPHEFEKLKIMVTAGFNGTHTVLLYAPGTVPAPDAMSLDYKTMIWQNVTMSRLKDLLFQIAYQGVIDYLGKTYYVPVFTNSTVSNFNFDAAAKSISFNVTGTAGTGFCNVTIPRSLLYAALGDWTVKIDGATLTPGEFIATENAEYVFIYLNYSHSDHTIEIVGTWVVTEFPFNMLLPILMILSLMATIIAVKKRKRLSSLKTRYQSAIRTFAKILHQRGT